ncbi:MAG: hypothetical protein GMKNLPBB_00769 [Myxococcota bacterium]|nr:hypothetical protein [Myxococcota bacterium]
MWVLLGAVLVSSLVGSLHCAGMCGGFSALGAAHDGVRGPLIPSAAYHAGRLVTYLLLGGLAGALGSAIDLTGRLAGMTHMAAMLSGVMVIALGTKGLLSAAGLRTTEWTPRWKRMGVWLFRLHRSFAGKPAVVRSLMLGLSSTLLPCGWLYAYAAAAAGTSDPLMGVAVMGVFWVGTVPALAGMGLLAAIASSRFRRRLPVLMPLLLITAGLVTIFWRAPLSGTPAANAGPAAASQQVVCHGE